MLHHNIINVFDINTNFLEADNHIKKCFPRHYRTPHDTAIDLSALHSEYNAATHSGLNETQKELFNLVRDWKIAPPADFNDDDIEAVFNAMGIRDGLGYELLELCPQEALNKIHTRFLVTHTNSPENSLLLSVLCNQIDAARALINGASENGIHLDSILIEQLSAINAEHQELSGIPAIFNALYSWQLPNRLINNPEGAQGILNLAAPIPLSETNCWHTSQNGKILQSPFQLAVKYGRTDIAALMLEHGARKVADGYYSILYPTEPPPPETLALAIEFGHLFIIDLFFQHNPQFSDIPFIFRPLLENSWKNFFNLKKNIEQVISCGNWDICESLISHSPSIQHLLEDNSLVATARRTCRSLLPQECQLHPENTPTEKLRKSVNNLCSQISASDLEPIEKLMIYTKTIAMIRAINNSNFGPNIKKCAISDFYNSTMALLPGSPRITKALLTVTAAAAGIAIGASAAILLAGLSIPTALLLGATCATGVGFFAHNHNKKKETVANLCDAAKHLTEASLTL